MITWGERHRETIVVAVAKDGVIGAAGEIPWHSVEDLHLFRQITMGGVLIMGRRTYESIGRPLPGRRIIVVSSTLGATAGITVVATFSQAVNIAQEDEKPIFYCGGSRIYQEALQRVDAVSLSRMEVDVQGDTFFPPLDPQIWEEESRQSFSGFTHILYARRIPQKD